MQRFKIPSEIIDFHDRRMVRPSFSWFDTSSHERAHFFTVAKALDLDLLIVLKTSIADALCKGWTFETWRRALLPSLAAIAWHRPRIVDDPLGLRAPEEADFTDVHRLQAIFRANMAIARSAGQWIRADRTKGSFDVLYCGPAAVHACHQHVGWAGVLLPVEHPWWDHHWPPNGWGCTCSVRSVYWREKDKLLAQGIGPNGCIYRAEPPGEGGPNVLFNKRTGRIHALPDGLEYGWDGNPGRDSERPLV